VGSALVTRPSCPPMLVVGWHCRLSASVAGSLWCSVAKPVMLLALQVVRSSVLLPAIPPGDAGPFRSLAQHLGLQIAEAAITAAVLRAERWSSSDVWRGVPRWSQQQ